MKERGGRVEKRQCAGLLMEGAGRARREWASGGFGAVGATRPRQPARFSQTAGRVSRRDTFYFFRTHYTSHVHAHEHVQCQLRLYILVTKPLKNENSIRWELYLTSVLVA